jgi:hypothetical protein
LTWLFNGQEFILNDDQKWAGFVYLITCNITGQKYVGKKLFYSITRVKVKGRANRKIVKKQSNWQNYWGSSKEFVELVEKYGKENFTREILSLHQSKGDINYHEMREQVIRDVLNDQNYENRNILCRWYRHENSTLISEFSIK